jgi:hypothetical protein
MAIKINVPLPIKGLTVDKPAEYVDSRATANIKNIETNRGIIRKRIGTVQIGASLGQRVMRYFELQVGSTTRLFRVGTTKVEVLNKTTGVWSSVATAPLTGAESNPVSFAFPLLSGAKIATYTNGVDNIRKCSITGNDADLGGSPPKARFLQAFGPYLVLGYIMSGGDTFYSRVQWCDTGAPETWTGGNSGSQDLLDDPEDMTGLGLMGSYLTVHKSKSIYIGQLVSGSDVIRFDRRATGVGAIAGATIQAIPSGQQVFLGSEGLHIFDGNNAPLIDAPIQDEIRERLNPLYAYKAQAISIRELDEYWVCLPLDSATEPTTIFKYNWRTGQIYKDERTALTSMGLYLNVAGALTWADMSGTWNNSVLRWANDVDQGLNPTVIFGNSSGVSTTKSDETYDDNEVANEAIWDTKDFTCEDYGIPDINTFMRWEGGRVWAKGDSLKVYYSTDSGDTWTLATTITLSDDYAAEGYPFYFDVVSENLRIRFLNSTSEEVFTVKKYQLAASPREMAK